MNQQSELIKRGTGIVRVLMKAIVSSFSEQEIWKAYVDLQGPNKDDNNILFKYIVLLINKNKETVNNQST